MVGWELCIVFSDLSFLRKAFPLKVSYLQPKGFSDSAANFPLHLLPSTNSDNNLPQTQLSVNRL